MDSDAGEGDNRVLDTVSASTRSMSTAPTIAIVAVDLN
jgi:hypothetical protein